MSFMMSQKPVYSSGGRYVLLGDYSCTPCDTEVVENGAWEVVGEGRGNYRNVEQITFVGEGNGDLERKVSVGWKFSMPRCFLFCSCLSLFLLLVAVLVLYPRTCVRRNERRTVLDDIFGRATCIGPGHGDLCLSFFPPPGCFPIRSDPYDCDAGYFNWQHGWSHGKKSWCCMHMGRGCPEKSDPFDCDAAYRNWRAAWSEAKKDWCCDHVGRGCPDAPVTPEHNCHLGRSDRWSASKKIWCCDQYGIGCAPRSTSLPYDCNAGLSNWEAGWSRGKKAWCCHHFDLGCVSTVPYDCNNGYSSWHSAWSRRKQLWCCRHSNRGCESTSSLPYDCDAGYDNWRAGWSEAKRQWCCAVTQRGCQERTSTSMPYDCDAGLANWAKGWSNGKKSWCCARYNRGCELPIPAEPQDDPYDCHHSYANWKEDWPAAKKAWCCHHRRMGCPAKFDCDAGFSNWKTGWSASKKAWCCEHEQKGCEAKPTFDCSKDFSHWSDFWSDVKKEWCCEHEQKGCPSKFDCHAALNNFHLAWSPAKKEWCCEKENKGCEGDHPPKVDPGRGMEWVHVSVNGYWVWMAVVEGSGRPKVAGSTLPYDCDAALSNFHLAWTPLKKRWCCTHEYKGCESSKRAPSADPGPGMVWRRAKVKGTLKSSMEKEREYWTWQAVPKGYHEHADAEGTDFDCDAALHNFGLAWSRAKKKWCCHKHGKGCEGKTSPSIDPGEGKMWHRVNWHGYWTWEAVKRDEEGSYDCEAAFLNFHLAWSPGKKQWCCAHKHKGCEGEEPPSESPGDGMEWHRVNVHGYWVWTARVSEKSSYDCNAALHNSHRAWSEGKKQWCCNNERKGCEGFSPPHVSPGEGMRWHHADMHGYWVWTVVPTHGHTDNTDAKYDCNAALNNFHRAWSRRKKTWCCLHEVKGCE